MPTEAALKSREGSAMQRGREFARPKGYPLVGVLPQIEDGNFLAFLSKMWREHGDQLRLDLGTQQMYCVIHPEDAKYVMQTNHRNFRKAYDALEDFLGNGLVMSNGDFWRRQRRLMNPMFLRKSVENYFEAMASSGRQMLANWAKHDPSKPLDMALEMSHVTQDVIVRTMFSKEFGPEIEELCDALEEVMRGLDRLMYMPRFMKNWPLPVNLRQKRALKAVRGAMGALIDEHERHPDRFDDLLTLLLQTRDEDGGKMDRKQLIDECTTIFFAGHETTANTLSWGWYMLSRHADVARKMYAEIDEVLQGRPPQMEDVKSLTYTSWVFEEILRMYPVAWTFQRQAVEEDILPSGYRVPAGATVNLVPYLTHRHPDFWENPEGFQPERFAPEAVKQREKSAYFPFGGGQRICIGNHFSLLEGPLLMAMIAQQYRLELAPGYQVKIKPLGTLRPNPALPMYLKPRADGPGVQEVASTPSSHTDAAPDAATDAPSGCPFHNNA